MARLPNPGGDSGTWGTLLNDFLSQVHASDGSLKTDSVGPAQLQDNAVTASAIAPNTITTTELAGNSVDATVIADGSVTGAKIANDTITSTNISTTAGITKTQLSAGVQASLSKADTALQSAPSGGGSYSGFPLRLPGEKTTAVAQELADARAYNSAPATTKTIVLAESWGKPGILKHIWMAAGNTYDKDGFMEQGGVIRIYTDDGSNPAISMTLGDFYCFANHNDVFTTPRIGRTSRGVGGESAAYRYLYMPFQKYLRVEVENNTNANVLFYGQADYSTITSFSDIGNQQRAYSIKGQRVSSQAAQTAMTVCNYDGSGQIESLWVSFSGASGSDHGVLEGNIEIYVDGEAMPSWSSSGAEDAFNGGWYTMPVGGYPAGRSGNSDQSGTNVSMYRFFVDDPIFFNSHLKVVAWAGQPNQAAPSSPTINYAAYVGVWSDTVVTPNYTAVDTTSAAILDDQMNQAAGVINNTNWFQSGDRTQASATGSTFAIPYGSSNPDQDVRIVRKNVSLPTDYWIETRVRITDATHDGQETNLIMLGSTPDPYFGSAIHIQFRRNNQYGWVVQLRDDFDITFYTSVGSGRDLTNTWVRMALKKEGTKVTGYYSLNPSPAQWIPVGTWTPTKTGVEFGVGTWTAGAEFDYLVVRPLQTVTS